eukprot:TRINITY_DN907_c0_g1_i1.p1 TRINITY_DN907_c0_g1~~TRINITY_DN907_c0_g1_i1.p1  ORF type:complete len:150 (-),score=20.86 TRINITY_DN907_c0_g1_i1:106-555(-)
MLCWEICTDIGLYSIIINFDTITSLTVDSYVGNNASLIVSLSQPPTYSKAYLDDFSMRWIPCDDFTGSQGSLFKYHIFRLPKTCLNEVLNCVGVQEPVFLELLMKGIPADDSGYFNNDNFVVGPQEYAYSYVETSNFSSSLAGKVFGLC